MKADLRLTSGCSLYFNFDFLLWQATPQEFKVLLLLPLLASVGVHFEES